MTEHVDQALLALRLSILDLVDASEHAETAEQVIAEAQQISEAATRLSALAADVTAAKHKQAAE